LLWWINTDMGYCLMTARFFNLIRAMWWWFYAQFLFVLANIAGNLIDTFAYDPKLFRYTKKLYLDRETSIPTYYSSLLLLISELLFGFIARMKQ
jgi:hypothetical protein